MAGVGLIQQDAARAKIEVDEENDAGMASSATCSP
jgi:hypothetical protein